MDMNDMTVITTPEVLEDVAEATATSKVNLKSVAKYGLIGVASVACWVFVVKPVWRKLRTAHANRKAKAMNETEAKDFDVENMTIEDVPEVEEE